MKRPHNRLSVDAKRQLLADLFAGKTDSLRTYKAISQQQAATPYRWVINDEITGIVYGVDYNGSQYPLTADDLAKALPNAVWRIVDHSGGRPIPKLDEDYH